jgi:hypothetical protein
MGEFHLGYCLATKEFGGRTQRTQKLRKRRKKENAKEDKI